MRTLSVTSFNAAAAPTTVPMQLRSPWHSPVPYLFGGLAAMTGLIAFALLILACSYWKTSGRIDGDVERGDNIKEQEGDASKSVKVYEEKILVIMAGRDVPTFLATPVSADHGRIINATREEEEEEAEDSSFETDEKVKDATTHHHHHHEDESNRDNDQETRTDQQPNQ